MRGNLQRFGLVLLMLLALGGHGLGPLQTERIALVAAAGDTLSAAPTRQAPTLRSSAPLITTHLLSARLAAHGDAGDGGALIPGTVLPLPRSGAVPIRLGPCAEALPVHAALFLPFDACAPPPAFG